MGLVGPLSIDALKSSARERIGYGVINAVSQLTEGTTTFEGEAAFRSDVVDYVFKSWRLDKGIEITGSGSWSNETKSKVSGIASRAKERIDDDLAAILLKGDPYVQIRRIALVFDLLEKAEEQGVPDDLLKIIIREEVEKRGLEWKGETDTSPN